MKVILNKSMKLAISGCLLITTGLFFASCDEENEEPVGPMLIGFTPASGTAGLTEVTVTGENFDATPQNNTVKFGSAVATVTTATPTSVTVVVPENAVTGKISITVNGITVTSTDDFIVHAPPSDFFTLTVDPSFNTSTADHWIMATTSDGDWIDVKPFETGETKVLHGSVGGNTFFLHYMTVSKNMFGDLVSIRTYSNVPAGGAWHLKTTTTTATTKDLALKMINYTGDRPSPNSQLEVTSNVGVQSGGGFSSGGNWDMSYKVQESPADILVTLYKDGFPHYAKFEDVELPTTISVDAATDVKIADRTYTLNLPANDSHVVSIYASRQDDPYPFNMATFFDGDGGSSVKLGYDHGYDKYSTRISYTNGKKSVDYSMVAATVEENPTFQPFNLTVTKFTANDFAAALDLTYDVSTIDFSYLEGTFYLIWNVIQPNPAGSSAITFRVNEFPPTITDQYPTLPTVQEISYVRVSGYQDLLDRTWTDVTTSPEGGFNMGMFSDNFYQFQLIAN
jgi:hypothetical protein